VKENAQKASNKGNQLKVSWSIGLLALQLAVVVHPATQQVCYWTTPSNY
jgi:hypothetical protein